MPSNVLAFLPFCLLGFPVSANLPAFQLKPSTVQHVTVVAAAAPEAVAAGGKVTLLLDVTPDRNIHVYAPGAKDFIATALKVTPESRVTLGKVAYPPAELVLDPILNERIPEYVKAFRITQPVTVAAKARPGESLKISGALTYQACDEKMCYAPSSAPVTWTLKVR